MRNWLIFIKERFKPAEYLPLILVFTWVNGMYLAKAENLRWEMDRYGLAVLMVLSFFFRLRLFDEIKDYAVDLKINPTRPLARGLLKIPDLQKVIAGLIVFELALSFYLGLPAFCLQILAIGYSLLMYKEFFIGDFLRPHLTTYAVTHTFSSVLIAFSAAVALTGFDPRELYAYHIAFFLMNWAFFNLFEFARKTFAADEERPDVPSYSNIFGTRQAYFLSISEGLMGVLLLHAALKNPLMTGFQSPLFMLAFIFYFLSTVSYFVRPKVNNAKIFRALTGVYLLLHYILIAYVLGV